MNIDHVTMAAPALEPLREVFASLGLATEYGGAHSNGATHMDLLGFDDGSYIELVAKITPNAPPAWWERFIVQAGGPCAWAVLAEDVSAEASRISGLGITVKGPDHKNRSRPDGMVIEWDSAFIGEGEPGATLPFIIKDRTPREWRVTPSGSVAGSELSGVVKVVLGARDPASAAKLFKVVYNWQTVHVAIDARLGINLLEFADTPVIIAAPAVPDSPLTQRLGLFGDSPMAFLIQSVDMEATAQRVPLGEEVMWFGKTIRWLLHDGALPQLGIIAGQQPI